MPCLGVPVGQLLAVDSVLPAEEPVHILAGLKEKEVDQGNLPKHVPYLKLPIQVLANFFYVFR